MNRFPQQLTANSEELRQIKELSPALTQLKQKVLLSQALLELDSTNREQVRQLQGLLPELTRLKQVIESVQRLLIVKFPLSQSAAQVYQKLQGELRFLTQLKPEIELIGLLLQPDRIHEPKLSNTVSRFFNRLDDNEREEFQSTLERHHSLI